MTHSITIPDPKMFVGISLMMFGGWLALEGALMASAGQLVIATIFITLGWWFRKRGASHVSGTGFQRWARFCAVAVPIFIVTYVIGYFVLMDRHSPTTPVGGQTRFDSSLRWAPHERVDKAVPPYETPWRSVTTWNIFYQPMDKLWFHFFPRSQQEIENLRETKYNRR